MTKKRKRNPGHFAPRRRYPERDPEVEHLRRLVRHLVLEGYTISQIYLSVGRRPDDAAVVQEVLYEIGVTGIPPGD